MTEINNLTTVYVPPVVEREARLKDWSTFREIIAALRAPDGCPWDREQTHASLKRYLIEEAHELLEAIDQEDDDAVIEELGDVLATSIPSCSNWRRRWLFCDGRRASSRLVRK